MANENLINMFGLEIPTRHKSGDTAKNVGRNYSEAANVMRNSFGSRAKDELRKRMSGSGAFANKYAAVKGTHGWNGKQGASDTILKARDEFKNYSKLSALTNEEVAAKNAKTRSNPTTIAATALRKKRDNPSSYTDHPMTNYINSQKEKTMARAIHLKDALEEMTFNKPVSKDLQNRAEKLAAEGSRFSSLARSKGKPSTQDKIAYANSDAFNARLGKTLNKKQAAESVRLEKKAAHKMALANALAQGKKWEYSAGGSYYRGHNASRTEPGTFAKPLGKAALNLQKGKYGTK